MTTTHNNTTEMINNQRTLLKAELNRYLPLLIEKYQPQKILLFDSMADNTTEAWSDIDKVATGVATRQPSNSRFREAKPMMFMLANNTSFDKVLPILIIPSASLPASAMPRL